MVAHETPREVHHIGTYEEVNVIASRAFQAMHGRQQAQGKGIEEQSMVNVSIFFLFHYFVICQGGMKNYHTVLVETPEQMLHESVRAGYVFDDMAGPNAIKLGAAFEIVQR
jgi:hypothetical protein